jgi:2-oxoisovalerate dehydrogenase E2 component (dihydrolipoyl transacylase)
MDFFLKTINRNFDASPIIRYSATFDITSMHNLVSVINTHIPEHFRPPSNTPPAPLLVSPSVVYPAPTQPRVAPSSQIKNITYLPILLKTLSKAMIEWPLFRSHISPNADLDAKPTLTIRPHADISIALSTPTGHYAPTIQQTNTHSIYSLASRLKHLAYLGRQIPCALTPAEMPRRGGTVTLSNVGAIGAADYAAPVLVPGGGVAIVAVGRAKWVWDVERGDGKGERRLKIGVSWSADHRVVEGAELAAFVETWRRYVEAPERLIAEGI